MAMWLGGVVLAEYVLNLVPRGTHHWEKMISPLNIQRMLDTSRHLIIKIKQHFYYLK